MALSELLDAVRKQVAAGWEKLYDYENEEDKDAYIDSIIAEMSVLDLLEMLSYLEN